MTLSLQHQIYRAKQYCALCLAMTPEQEHKRRIRQRLRHLRYLRRRDTPPYVLRHEQLVLWSLRRMRTVGRINVCDVPGWNENIRKFVTAGL